jgi:hypothetical protein
VRKNSLRRFVWSLPPNFATNILSVQSVGGERGEDEEAGLWENEEEGREAGVSYQQAVKLGYA